MNKLHRVIIRIIAFIYVLSKRWCLHCHINNSVRIVTDGARRRDIFRKKNLSVVPVFNTAVYIRPRLAPKYFFDIGLRRHNLLENDHVGALCIFLL